MTLARFPLPRIFHIASLGLLLGMASWNQASAQNHSAEPIKVLSIGQPSVIYDTQRDGCSALDTPDSSPRAIRDSNGQIHLFGRASIDHEKNHEMIGPDFSHLRPSCDVAYQGAINPNPAAYNDNRWLSAYFVDNKTVYALVHNEWHGNENHALCPSGSPDCNEESVSEVYSTDGGYHFKNFPDGIGLVAALPYQYRQAGHFFGIGGSTNIVKAGGYYYAMVFQIHPENKSLNGACVIRTSNIADPSAWRGWSGHDFTITFVNPYHTNVGDPAAHLCVSLPTKAFFNAYGLYYVPARQSFVLMVRKQVWDKNKHDDNIPDTPGIYLYESKDMINWSAPTLLMSDDQAGGVEQRYPSLIDPNSSDPSFTTLGTHLILYTVTSVKGAGYGSTKILARSIELAF